MKYISVGKIFLFNFPYYKYYNIVTFEGELSRKERRGRDQEEWKG